ncbi:MAG: response regulator [Planctomycetes bacterium]|nr:response regulator [Planctomycetota bacterium]
MLTTLPRILVIDDDPVATAVTTEVLSAGHRVLVANDGAEGLAIALRERPDIVLLDISMPGMDGYETCRRMRASPALAHAKILLVSGHGETRDRVRGYDAGADDHLGKPFDAAELLAKIRVFLRLKGAEQMEQMKSGLLDLMAHEIRTPLSAILPAVEMLSADYDLSDDDRKLLLRAIGDGARRLVRLTERASVLQRARAGGLQLRRRDVDIADLLRAAVQNAPGVHVVGSPTAPIHGDPTLVTLAIEELLNHTSQHAEGTPIVDLDPNGASGDVCIRFLHAGRTTITAPTKICLEVMSEDVRDGQTVGAHLGLPTADAIVQAHGGSLWQLPPSNGLVGIEMRLPRRR